MKKSIVVLVLVGGIAAGAIFAYTFDLVKPHKIDEFEVFTKKEAGLEQTFFRVPNPPQHEQIFADNYAIYVPNGKLNVVIIAKEKPTELCNLIFAVQDGVVPGKSNKSKINVKDYIAAVKAGRTPTRYKNDINRSNNYKIDVEIGKTFIVMLDYYNDSNWIMNAFDNNEFEARILVNNDYMIGTLPPDYDYITNSFSINNLNMDFTSFFQKEYITICFKAKKTGSFLLKFTRYLNSDASQIPANKEVIVNVLPPQNEVF